MQQLMIVKQYGRYSLYCAMCKNLFDKDFVLDNIEYFLDIHKQMHTRMDLNTPDIEETYTVLSE